MSQIITKFIQDDAITNPKIADNAVDSLQIADNAVVEAKIADDAVTANKIASNAVTSSKINADAVDETKIRLSNDAFLRARNAADSADVDLLKLNASDVIEFASLPQSAGTPSAATDLTTKAYVDSVSGGDVAKLVKKPVKIFFDDSYSFDPTGIGVATYQGFNLAIGDRTLYMGTHASGASKGIYEVTGATSSARVADSDNISEYLEGTMVYISEGDFAGSFAIQRAAALSVFADLDFRIEGEVHNQSITLSATDITNQYVDLTFRARPSSVMLVVDGVVQWEGDDFTMSVVSGISRLTFAGDLATGGAAELVAGDTLRVNYVKASY